MSNYSRFVIFELYNKLRYKYILEIFIANVRKLMACVVQKTVILFIHSVLHAQALLNKHVRSLLFNVKTPDIFLSVKGKWFLFQFTGQI